MGWLVWGSGRLARARGPLAHGQARRARGQGTAEMRRGVVGAVAGEDALREREPPDVAFVGERRRERFPLPSFTRKK